MYGDTCRLQDLTPVINHLHTILDEEAGKTPPLAGTTTPGRDM